MLIFILFLVAANVDKSHGMGINWEKKHPVHWLFLGLVTNRHRRILFYRDPGYFSAIYKLYIRLLNEIFGSNNIYRSHSKFY